MGSSSLSMISLSRLCGILRPASSFSNLTPISVYLILVGIWGVALAAAVPTEFYREYWIRAWADVVEINCDDLGGHAEGLT